MEDRIVQWAEDGSAFTALADGCRSDWPAILRTGRGARGCVCTCFAWHRRNDGNNGQDTQDCMNLTYFYTTYLSTKNDFKNFMSNLNPSPVRSDHVSNGPCQYCTVFRLGSPAYRTPSSFRMKSRPAAACPDSESRCLEIRDLAAAHPKRPTRGGLRPRGRRRAYELHQGQPPLPSSPSP